MAISLPVQLGRQIAVIRKSRGLTQTQLADLSQVGRAHLSQIENGAVAARIDTVKALADVLEIKLRDLFQDMD